MQDGMGKSTSLRSRGRSRQWFRELAASATGTAPHQTGLCPTRPSCSPHPLLGIGGFPVGLGGSSAAPRRAGGHSRAEELGTEWDGQGRGSRGSVTAPGGGCLCGLIMLSTSQGRVRACCRWLSAAGPCPWGWLLTPRPRASSPEHPVLDTHHCSDCTLEPHMSFRSSGPGDSPASPMRKRWLCCAEGCSVLCHPLSSPPAPRGITFHGSMVRAFV